MSFLPMLFLVAMLGLMIGLGYMAFANPSSRKVVRRLDALKERHSSSQNVLAQAQMRRILAHPDSRLDRLFERFLPKPALLRKRLDRTGKNWSLGQFGTVSAAILLITLLLLLAEGTPVLLALLTALFLALFIPHMIIGILIKRRIGAFTKRLPDAIELLVRGLRSGLPISETLVVVAREVPDPVGWEFRNVVDKIRIGLTMDQALQETADRLTTPEFQFFVITLAIQRETGGNLAETLASLADVLRKRAQMKLKIKAMSSEAKASAYIVGALPFAVFTLVWAVNPGYLEGFFSDPRLMIAGAGGLTWMAIGAFIMSKMASFEV